jgi:hypothetical protein
VLADILDDRGKAVAGELGDAARYPHLDITARPRRPEEQGPTSFEVGPISSSHPVG